METAWIVAIAVAMFAMQLLLCLKARRLAVKLIPAYLVCGVLLYGAAAFLGLFGTYSAGALAGHELAGLVIFLMAGIAAAGSLLGWAVYGLTRLTQRAKATFPDGEPEGAAPSESAPRRWKKAALIVAAAAVAVCAVVYLNPTLRTRAFVALHAEELESSIEAGHGVPAWLGDYDYDSFAREHSMLQITLAAYGDTYYGCYYSFDGVPLAFQNADVPLMQNGHEYWEWQAEGDNHGSTERISGKWFYFEASF